MQAIQPSMKRSLQRGLSTANLDCIASSESKLSSSLIRYQANRRSIQTLAARKELTTQNQPELHQHSLSAASPSRSGAVQGQATPRKISTTTRSYSTAIPTAQQPVIHHVFESNTGSWQYVVADPTTSTAVIIDPVLDFDPSNSNITTQSADSLLALIREKEYSVSMILETHAHADHLTAAAYLQKRLATEQGHKPNIAIGKRITQIQKFFGKRYGIAGQEYDVVFDKFFDDDESIQVGNLIITALHLPGHTPDHMGYKIGDNVFVGDSIFPPNLGTARADFPGGSAEDLWASGRKLLSLPEHTKIYVGHDYPPPGTEVAEPGMTVAYHRECNKHLKDGVEEEEFLSMRKGRDKILGEPKLLHQSLQINIRAGRLPAPSEAGQRLLHVPMKPKTLQW